MEKIDYKKEFKSLYSAAAKTCSVVSVPSIQYLMLDGSGNPNDSAEFQAAVRALFSVSYTLKFMIKKTSGTDYGVMPLEGLWWAEDMQQFTMQDKAKWQWTLMIMQPGFISEELCQTAIEKTHREKGLSACKGLRFGYYDEGTAAQILHVGPFSAEGPTVQALHSFISESNYQLHGKHHEIYLSDPRRSAPEKWKTIVRQPIAAMQ